MGMTYHNALGGGGGGGEQKKKKKLDKPLETEQNMSAPCWIYALAVSVHIYPDKRKH